MKNIKFDERLLYKLESIYAKDGKTKVKQKDLAIDMGMAPEQFSKNKKEGQVPYKYIILYCIKKEVNISWLLGDVVITSYEKENTALIEQWTSCREDLLGRINGKYDKKCEKVSIFFRKRIKHSCNDLNNLSRKAKSKVLLLMISSFILGFFFRTLFL